MSRRRFNPEYKQEAVLLVKQSDIPISEIARNLGINDKKSQLCPVTASIVDIG